jgi:hypothetical protein
METIDCRCRPSGRSAPSGLASMLAASSHWNRGRDSRWKRRPWRAVVELEGLYLPWWYPAYWRRREEPDRNGRHAIDAIGLSVTGWTIGQRCPVAPWRVLLQSAAWRERGRPMWQKAVPGVRPVVQAG